MITLRLSRFTFKILFSIALLVGKIVLFPVSSLAHGIALGIQATMVAFSVIADLLKENEDRKTFKRFYDYRESHAKFRNLMVSGLPTSLLIISRDLKQKLFSNECLEEILREEVKDGVSKSQIGILKEWLDRLKIEYKSLKQPLVNSNSFENLCPSVLDLLRSFEEQQSRFMIVSEQKLTLSAEYSKEEKQGKKKSMRLIFHLWSGIHKMLLLLY